MILGVLYYSKCMSDVEDTDRRPRGRPVTGVTAKRQVRIGDEWDRAERLALALAEQDGTVREVKSRATGEAERKGDTAGYVEAALKRENDRVERLLQKAVKPCLCGHDRKVHGLDTVLGSNAGVCASCACAQFYPLGS